MVISGSWQQNDDGVTRPVIEIQVVGAGSRSVEEIFLIDSGADRSLFWAGLLDRLEFEESKGAKTEKLHGLMGICESRVVNATLILKTREGQNVRINGDFPTTTDPATVDI